MLESIDKLRKLRGAVEANDVDNPIWVCNKATIIADEIERETSERYIPLPVDADGVAWKRDDGSFVAKNGNKHELVAMRIDCDGKWLLRSPLGWYIPSECRHIKPRTMRDVLFDFMRDCETSELGNSELVEKYEAELRKLLGGDE